MTERNQLLCFVSRCKAPLTLCCVCIPCWRPVSTDLQKGVRPTTAVFKK